MKHPINVLTVLEANPQSKFRLNWSKPLIVRLISSAPPIKDTSLSSALRVKASVFQWVKKALSIVRKNNLRNN